MARRKFAQVDDRKLKHSPIPCCPDTEDDDNEGETLEEGQGWLWEKELLSKKDDDYYSCSSPEEYYYHCQKSIFYSKITNIQEYDDDDDDDLEDYDYASPKILDVKLKGICISHPLEPRFAKLNTWNSSMEKGESSWSECAICHDDKPTGAMEKNAECGHFFCEGCMRGYVREKFQENSSIYKKIKCPKEKCNKDLGLQQFLPYIPDEKVCDRIVDARRESEVLANPTIIKCPLLHCSARFVDDCKDFKIRACPGCWSIFCVVCGVIWHMGKSCQQYQNEVRAQAQAQARARAALGVSRSELEDDSPRINFFT